MPRGSSDDPSSTHQPSRSSSARPCSLGQIADASFEVGGQYRGNV